jgi:hypothetical protein
VDVRTGTARRNLAVEDSAEAFEYVGNDVVFVRNRFLGRG